MIPHLRPIKVKTHHGKMNARVVINQKEFSQETQSKNYTKKAIIVSCIMHAFIFVLKFPEMVTVEVPQKEKLAAIKMNVITPPDSYKVLKKKIAKAEADKINTKEEAGVKKVTTKQEGKTGDPNAPVNQVAQKSKKGSAKKGPLSAPTAEGAVGLGDSAKKGYEFKGKGFKALMGDSGKISLPAGSGDTGSRALRAGTGIANKGDNLSGDYRAPSGIGDGSGHLLGTDSVGNYDRSTTTRGLANKKGIDTAFVQADTVVMGSIEPEILRQILQEYLPQFRFCYQQELQEQSEKIKGIVDLNFRIEGDGKVSKVDIKSAKAKFSDKGISCMANILRIIDFPKPKGGGLVDVRQPLNFFSESTKI